MDSLFLLSSLSLSVCLCRSFLEQSASFQTTLERPYQIIAENTDSTERATSARRHTYSVSTWVKAKLNISQKPAPTNTFSRSVNSPTFCPMPVLGPTYHLCSSLYTCYPCSSLSTRTHFDRAKQAKNCYAMYILQKPYLSTR